MDLAGTVADAIRSRKKKSAALRKAVASGDNEEVVRQLVKSGMHSETFTLSEDSPLLHAARTGQSVIIGLLVGSGADVNCPFGDLNSTALHVAAECRQVEVVSQLLAAGADVRKTNLSGQTPLHCAAKADCPKAVAGLIHAGADVAARDAFGDTPLSCAVQHASVEVVSLLLFVGANPDVEGRDKNTPMHAAAARGKLDIIAVLLGAGAHPSPRRTDTGETPLFIAAREGFTDVVHALLSSGAKANEKMNGGLTPLDVAKRNRHYFVARLLGPALHVAGGRQDKRQARQQRGPDRRTTENVSDVRRALSASCVRAEKRIQKRFSTNALENDSMRMVLHRKATTVDSRPEGERDEGSCRNGDGVGELEDVIRESLTVRPFGARCKSLRSPKKREAPSIGEPTRSGSGSGELRTIDPHVPIDKSSFEDTVTESGTNSSVDDNDHLYVNALWTRKRGAAGIVGTRNGGDSTLEDARIAPNPATFFEYDEQDGDYLHENELWCRQRLGGNDQGLVDNNATRQNARRRKAVWSRLKKLTIPRRNRHIDGQI